jgi:hypothetical protein
LDDLRGRFRQRKRERDAAQWVWEAIQRVQGRTTIEGVADEVEALAQKLGCQSTYFRYRRDDAVLIRRRRRFGQRRSAEARNGFELRMLRPQCGCGRLQPREPRATEQNGTICYDLLDEPEDDSVAAATREEE